MTASTKARAPTVRQLTILALMQDGHLSRTLRDVPARMRTALVECGWALVIDGMYHPTELALIFMSDSKPEALATANKLAQYPTAVEQR